MKIVKNVGIICLNLRIILNIIHDFTGVWKRHHRFLRLDRCFRYFQWWCILTSLCQLPLHYKASDWAKCLGWNEIKLHYYKFVIIQSVTGCWHFIWKEMLYEIYITFWLYILLSGSDFFHIFVKQPLPFLLWNFSVLKFKIVKNLQWI